MSDRMCAFLVIVHELDITPSRSDGHAQVADLRHPHSRHPPHLHRHLDRHRIRRTRPQPHQPTLPRGVRVHEPRERRAKGIPQLVLDAKARAAMDGRAVPDLDDVKAVPANVLGHRVVLNFQAEAEGVGVKQLVQL